nr:MAG TPA: Protein of unknown function (DUF2977) [Caudoviricetes sp.]
MNILLDEQGYFTGNYAVEGKIVGGVEISELPPYEDMKKQISCKFENEKWIFDEEKYQEILNRETKEKKQAKIKELQSELNESDYKIIKCNEYKLAGLELPYDIEELHKQRQALRDEINKLQGE